MTETAAPEDDGRVEYRVTRPPYYTSPDEGHVVDYEVTDAVRVGDAVIVTRDAPDEDGDLLVQNRRNGRYTWVNRECLSSPEELAAMEAALKAAEAADAATMELPECLQDVDPQVSVYAVRVVLIELGVSVTLADAILALAEKRSAS